MDTEFHYYINFIIAAAAGFSAANSYKIAYSAQYVDDNINVYHIYNPEGQLSYSNDNSQTFDITLDYIDLVKTYACLHFMPGDRDKVDKNLRGYDVGITLTTPNSRRAKYFLRTAMQSKNPYMIGVMSHMYADTWAHQNFSALNHGINSGVGILTDIIPNYGHADFLSYPDEINAIWHDHRLSVPEINNNERFMQSIKCLFYEYATFNKLKNVEQQSEKLCSEIQAIFDFPLDMIAQYKRLCKQVYHIDLPAYHSYQWENEAIIYNDNEKRFEMRYNFGHSNWLNFQNAVIQCKRSIWPTIVDLFLDYI